MTRSDLIEAYAGWLSPFPWQWFVTLTFRGYPSSRKAESLFRTWISEVEVCSGSPAFCWVRVVEHGAFGDHLHYHVLVGGLLRRTIFEPWKLRWLQLGRSIEMRTFNPDFNAIYYTLKSVSLDADFDIDLHLPRTFDRFRVK